MATARSSEIEGPANLLDLGVAAYEARQPAGGGDVKSASLGTGSGEHKDFDRARQALDRNRAPGRDLHVPFRELQRGRREQDGAGRRHLLHTRGQMGRLPDRRVVHVQIGVDGAHEDVARVDTNADLNGHSVRAEDFLGILSDGLLHSEGGVARPDRVVLVRQRRAEKGHDPIAHHLVDGTLVPVHRLDHPFEYRVEQLPRLLRTTVGKQLHRALEIGEEYRDLLALARQRGLRVDDAFGKMLRRVGVRRGQLPCTARAQRRTALAAKLLPGRIGGAASQTRVGQASATVPAKLLPCGVLLLAPGTLHSRASAKRAGVKARRR